METISDTVVRMIVQDILEETKRKMKKNAVRGVVANRLGVDPSDKVLEEKVSQYYQFYMDDNGWEKRYVPLECVEFHPIPDSFTDNIASTDTFDVDPEMIRKQNRLQLLPGFPANEDQKDDLDGEEADSSTKKYMKKYSAQNEDNLGMESLRRLAIAGNKKALLRGLSAIESVKQRKSLLARRLRHAGFRWKGKYPSEEDIKEVMSGTTLSDEEGEEKEKE